MNATLATKLPFELILRVIDALAPSTAVALPATSSTAKCIRAFTLVCRATYPVALRLLYSDCLYIESSDRLRKLLVSIQTRLPPDPAPEAEYEKTLTPLTHESTLPPVDIFPCLQSLYLSPYSRSIDDLPIAHWIFELCTIVRHTLKRLVIDIPFTSLDAEHDHLNVRPRLRAAFQELTSVEEFISLDDDFHLSIIPQWSLVAPDEPPVWASWTNLRRLGLHHPILTRPYYTHFQHLKDLEQVLIASPSADSQHCWNAFFEQLTRARNHDVHVVYPMKNWGDYVPMDRGFTHYMDRNYWARIWNTLHHHDGQCEEEDGQQKGSRILFSTVVVDKWYDLVAGWEGKSLRKWVSDQALRGTIWDVERCARLRRSHVDRDLWLDESVEEGLKEEVYDEEGAWEE